MYKVAIIGPGLLGASMAMALRQRGDCLVAIWARRSESIVEAQEMGFADLATTDLALAVQEASIIVLCTPIGSMSVLARQLVPLISAEALITDVGSVKGCVVTELGPIFKGHGRFVGSHPMAGSEQTGMKAARADLFVDCTCVITPEESSEPRAVAELAVFWEGLGCRVHKTTPARHDEMVALVSHFPHLLAASLVDMIAKKEPGAFALCGPGFRDTTRVASGSAAMWTEILRSNRDAVRNSTEAMIEKLREIVRLLDSGSPDHLMQEFLNQAKAQRDCLRLPR